VRDRGETQFTRSGEVDIAYQVIGSGDRGTHALEVVVERRQPFAVEQD
jgi:hypothetical protein